MSNTKLRYAPWHDRSRLSPSQYVSLTAAVSKVLCYTVSIPHNRLDVIWAQEFVRSYAQDAAKHALHVLDEEEAKETKLTVHEVSIRRLTLQLAQRLSKIRDGLDVSILVDLAVSYRVGNSHSLRTIVQEACTSTPSLQESFMHQVVPTFGTSLQEVQNRSSSSTRKVTFVLLQLLRCGPTIINFFIQSRDFVLTLARSYHAGLDNFAKYHGGVTLQLQDSEVGWQRDWLFTKASLVDAFHVIVQTLLRGEQPSDKDLLFDLLFSMSEISSSSTSEHITPIPFISQSLLADYQYAFDLSSLLSDRFQGMDDARVDLLTSALVKLSPSQHGKKPAGGLSLLIKNQANSGRIATDLKGKGKAPVQDPTREANLDQAIAQVMDIFPLQSLQYIRQCLEHPAFDGNSEKLISSLLEGTLPNELVNHGENPLSSVQPLEDFKYVKDRRNVWDEDKMDFSRLRIGKVRDTADSLLHDRSFIDQMKADIIRRAEELSSDEDVDDNSLAGRKRVVSFFEEELDDNPLTDKGVKVAGDGEASEDSDGEHEPEDSKPSLESILISAYMHDSKVYDRDSATRRSKARAELKLKTGWVDEQIEGWRIMLERNPRKDKILQKYEFSGNSLLLENTNSMEPGPSRGASAQRGGGARGRGASRATDDTARGRDSKEKNKARAANHNRKRGHDKKMARGGAPIV